MGTYADFYFLEPATGQRIHARGRVVRSDGPGFAVEFTHIQRALARLILVATEGAKSRK